MEEQAFLAELKEIELLKQALALLEWDSQTGMPQKASEARGEAVGYLTERAFKKEVGPQMKAYLDYFSEHPQELSEVGAAALAKVKETYEQEQAVPSEKMQVFSKAVSVAHTAWQQAREDQDFTVFEAALARNIALTKAFIPLWQKDEANAYDVLLNRYEPGMTTAILDQVFAKVLAGIKEIRQKLTQGSAPRTDFLSREVPKAQQERFIRQVVQELGYDFSRGRLDDTIHPFMISINHNDARLTTRWHENDFKMAVFGTIHEAGHGMYEQNIAEKYAYTPVHQGTSMGIHESQSLFNELLIGSNRAFWQKQYPFFQECTEGTFADIDFETFYRGLHATQASLVRIEADSLTYPIHIIIRYEIEKMIFNEDLPVSQLPQVWQQKYQEYLGITPTNDVTGILQDVHWSGASFGYFPSYALGYIYAAQLHHSMKQELAFDDVLGSADYRPIRQWLTKHIHQYGAAKKPAELMTAATGELLEPQYLLDYLRDLYYSVYQIKH